MVYCTLPPFGRHNAHMHSVYYTLTSQTNEQHAVQEEKPEIN